MPASLNTLGKSATLERSFPSIAGLRPEVTPAVDHYVVDIDINDPVIDGHAWRLRVGGRVDRPLELGYEA